MCARLTTPGACSDYAPAVLATGAGIQVVTCDTWTVPYLSVRRILGPRTHAAAEGPHRPSGDT